MVEKRLKREWLRGITIEAMGVSLFFMLFFPFNIFLLIGATFSAYFEWKNYVCGYCGKPVDQDVVICPHCLKEFKK